MSKCQPKLSEMPWNVKQQIVDGIQDSWDKLSLRQCSKPFRLHVDKSPIQFKGLHLTLTFAQITVKLDVCEGRSLEKIFKLHENGVQMENTQMNWSSIRNGEDYRKAAVEKLMGVFTMFPKARIGELFFIIDPVLYPFTLRQLDLLYPQHSYEQDIQVIFEEMHRIGTRIPVESLHLNLELKQEHVLKVLELCEPTTLTSISWDKSLVMRCSSYFVMDRIVETEQWRQAKKTVIFAGHCALDFEKLAHFDSINFSFQGATPATVKTILETFLNRPSFQHCWLFSNHNFDTTGADEYLEQLDKRPDSTIASPLDHTIRFRASVDNSMIFLFKIPVEVE